jgi:uncharacterized protein (TIGR02996 family)
MNQREAFLCDVCENPDDDTPRLVFADWLEDNGDPQWAEFIRVQIALSRLPSWEERRVGLMARERELWDEIGERLLADLPDEPALYWGGTDEDTIPFERGFAGVVQVDDVAALRAHRRVFLTKAPVRTLWLDHLTTDEAASLGGPGDPPGLARLELEGAPADEETDALVDADLLRALADSPLSRRLTGLDLFNTGVSPAALAVLASEPAFAGLRRLRLDNNFPFPTGTRAAEILGGSAVLAGLTDLSLEMCSLGDAAARLLAASPYLTRLERLELHSNIIGPVGLRAFVEGPDRPNLTHFSLGSNAVRDEGAAILAAWPALSRFRRLHLANNEISAAFIESLAAGGALAEIERIQLIDCTNRTDALLPGLLSVYRNYLSAAGVEALVRSPHRGRLLELELWSRSLVQEKSEERLREFFRGDERVR